MKALPVFKLTETELRPGTSLIEASAGTGKTYTIAGLFLRLILEQDLAVDQILVVTYTVAATEELRNRIRQTLAKARAAFERSTTTRSGESSGKKGALFPLTPTLSLGERESGRQRICEADTPGSGERLASMPPFLEREGRGERDAAVRPSTADESSYSSRHTTEDPFLTALVKKHAGRSKVLAERLTRALDGFDEAPIYTIHGFCQRVLKDRAFETGSLFDTELVTDQMPLLRQLVEDYWRKHFYRAGRLPVLFALKNELSPEGLLPLIRESLPHPSLRLLSSVDGQDPASLAAKLEEIFGSLREVWRAEKGIIRGYFGSGAKWANKPYNDDDLMGDALGQVEHCLGAPEFPPSALEALRTFRTTDIAKGTFKKAKSPAPAHRFFDLCEELARVEDHYVISLRLQAFRYVERELPRRKDELKIQFFDDLLRRVHGALAGERGEALAAILRRTYPAALIDEFQDTDPLQYAIFHRVFAGPQNRLFLIGDPKQAIYGFRGADIFTYLKASQQSDQAYTLRENWRSESGLVRSVNAVFSAAARPFVFPGIHFQPVEAKGEADEHPLKVAPVGHSTSGDDEPGVRPSSGAAGAGLPCTLESSRTLRLTDVAAPEDGRTPPFQLWFWRRTGKVINKGTANERLPAVVASEIIALLDGKTTLGDRPLLPEDIAVLVPDNYQAQLVQNALSRRRVPSVLYTTASLFQSREVADTQRVLAAIADPTREAQLKAALATDLLGYTGAQIEALAKQDAEWQQILERFRDYLDLWIQKGFIQMFRSVMQREQVRPRLLAFPDGERRLTNLLHLGEVLHRASMENRLGVSGLLKWLSEQQEAEDQPAEEHQLRLETDEKAVKLVTIHKSKGLEYPVVFCPFSWKGASIEHGGGEQVFFHEQGDGDLARDLGSPDYEAHKQLALVERLAQEVRLLYVALTRAKHRCYIAWGAFKDAATSAPARLLHPPPSDEPDAVAAQEKHFADLDDAQMLEDLHTLAEQTGGAEGKPMIQVQDLPEPTEATYTVSSALAPALECRKFTGAIARDWRISSFTSLTANQGEEQPDHDELGGGVRGELPASGIFAFPGGAKPGTCLHKILERLDFTQWAQPATRDLVRDQLRAHGLPATEFSEAVLEMLGKVMTTQLDENVPGLTLAKITAAQRLHELEFYFPLQRISPDMIRALYQEHRILGARDSGGEPGGFSFVPVQGMLKGFIDLVFEFRGRFYLVDWKSNRLGDQIEDYSVVALAGEIRRRHYYFQYQLYTAALDRYLRLRLPGYSYDKHFGGVYYLFLRGIDPARPGFGIHRDRLEESFVRKLNGLLTGGAGGTKP